MKKFTSDEILDTAAEGFTAVEQWEGWPKTHSNYVVGITDGALLVTLTTGQTFRITAEEVR